MRPAARLVSFLVCSVLSCLLSEPARAGFASMEAFLPAVGRLAGQGGAQFYTTVWVTNLSSAATVHFTFQFLKQGQGNASGAPSFSDTLAPGETKIYENVVEEKLGLSGQLGAARITADGEIFASERIYDQAHPGDDLGTTEGLFFAAVPATFSIGLGETASVQGVNQGDPSEDMRYNFALVETSGQSATVHVRLLSDQGASLGAADFALQPYEQVQPNVAQLFAGVATNNARVEATVTAGAGKVLLAGAQLANTSQDSSGFEMSFKDSLLGGGGGPAGVASVNGLTGALSLVAGTNVTLTNVGSSAIRIDAAAGGGGGGLASVAHDTTLAGSGTGGSPLGVAFPLKASLSNSTETLVNISNMAPDGSAIVGFGGQVGVGGFGSQFAGVVGVSQGVGVIALNGSGNTTIPPIPSSGIGVFAFGDKTGVYAKAADGGTAVFGFVVGANPGILGENQSSGSGVEGISGTGRGVSGVSLGTNAAGVGVFGECEGTNANGVVGKADSGPQAYGVWGRSASGFAGHFDGNVAITGTLAVTGAITAGVKDFKIDHPLDPENKYLVHASVESSEMTNIYSGNVTLGPGGFAVVSLPAWVEAANGDFRYQLTCIGGFAGVYVERELEEGRFTIGGGLPGLKVSWQLTGIRRDAYARAHPIVVEEDKTESERGLYLHPEAFGHPGESGIDASRRRAKLSASDAMASAATK
jgi:hypothetical protein